MSRAESCLGSCFLGEGHLVVPTAEVQGREPGRSRNQAQGLVDVRQRVRVFFGHPVHRPVVWAEPPGAVLFGDHDDSGRPRTVTRLNYACLQHVLHHLVTRLLTCQRETTRPTLDRPGLPSVDLVQHQGSPAHVILPHSKTVLELEQQLPQPLLLLVVQPLPVL
jgi:hypothetical protein